MASELDLIELLVGYFDSGLILVIAPQKGKTASALHKFHKDAVDFRGGVGGARDLASDDQIVGAIANRL